MKTSFIGYGAMATALAQGLRRAGMDNIHAYTPSMNEKTDEHGVCTTPNPSRILRDPDVVILAVKPAIMAQVIEDIRPHLSPECLLISVAAGLSPAWFENTAHLHRPLIQAMPNLASAWGKGATAFNANALVTPQHKRKAERLGAAWGRFIWVSSADAMNAFTALAGSGPAYIYLFLEALEKGAVALGLAPDIAHDFALQTMTGALAVAEHSGESLASLRKKVTSPAGTTAAAIAILDEEGFEGLVARAMKAAFDRACALGTR